MGVAFRPDGNAVLTGVDWNLQEWDAKTGRKLGPPMQNYNIHGVAYSPDGKSVVAGYMQDRCARQWNLATRQKRDPPLAHQGWVRTVCYSPDGKSVLTGSSDQTARLWDAATGHPIGSPMEHTGDVLSVAFSPDGKTVATGCADNCVRFWKVAPNRTLQSFFHPIWVRAVAFSPDGKRLFTGCADFACRLWDVGRGVQVGRLFNQDSWVTGVALSADGKTAFGVSQHRLYHWDLGSGRLLGSADAQDREIAPVAAGPGSATLVTALYAAQIWDVATLKPRGAPLRHDKGGVGCVAISPDGQVVLTGADDGTIRKWDSLTGLPIGPPVQLAKPITAVAFNSDGKQVLTGSADGSAQRWDAGTWKPLGALLRHRGFDRLRGFCRQRRVAGYRWRGQFRPALVC